MPKLSLLECYIVSPPLQSQVKHTHPRDLVGAKLFKRLQVTGAFGTLFQEVHTSKQGTLRTLNIVNHNYKL